MAEENKPKNDFNPFGGLKNNGKIKKPKFNSYWIYGIIMLAILATQLFTMGGGAQETSWKVVQDRIIPNGDLKKVEVIRNKGIVNIYLKPETLEKYSELNSNSMFKASKLGPHFYFTIGDIEVFEKRMEEAQKKLPQEQRIYPVYTEQRDWFSDIMPWILPLLIIAIWIFFFRKMNKNSGGGGVFNVGKSQAKLFEKGDKTNISFKQVAGLAEAKEEVEEIVSFLKNPSKYTQLGGKIPKGALLVGPPGTGKTLLAKAVAGEADVPFFSMSGSDFVEMFVGVGASRVRDLFKQAKLKSPCIIFIDEIDAIGRARGKNPNMGSNDERENTLNQLLTEMDGFDTNSGVIILAATNRADILDKALLRAGRFDRQIQVELPDLNERKEIFDVHLKPLKLDKDLNKEFLSKQTPGFSGADIANVCNEAALIAARNDKKSVEKQDFLDAIDRIIGGLEKKNKIIKKEEKSTIAYHEAGHATISWFLEHAHPLVKVTIVPRGKALGAAWYMPQERQITTKEQMLDEMCATLGGRVAEEIIFGKISTGAQNDLEKVTKSAYAMISIYGMSNLVGNVSYYDSTGQSDYSFSKPYSEKTAELIDSESKKLIDNQYDRAREILLEHADGHKKLAELLLEREVIFSEDLEEIFGKRQWEIPNNI
ncbi:ATP-dependent zinc metalloprotease FtsH [Marinilabiliaceae bacterium JC040]|nr:ATP-dependent zinc metalloprotease FtsH [Marinilabiliaceae bacterium JC040]